MAAYTTGAMAQQKKPASRKGSLSSFGFIFATDFIMLLSVRILQGFCSAMIVPIAQAYVGEITPPDKEGSYMGQFNVAIFFGFGFGPLLGGGTSPGSGLPTIYESARISTNGILRDYGLAPYPSNPPPN